METASTPSKEVLTEGQAGKLVDQLRPGLVEALVESKIPREKFQQLIMRERELRVRTRFVQFVISIIAEIIDWVIVHCNYSEENAIANAISAGNFDTKYLGLQPEQIPLIGKGEVDHEVGELHLNEYLTTREVIEKVKERGDCQFATPLAALRYGVKLPDRQRQYPLAIIFEIGDHVWCLILHEVASKRFLHVHPCLLDVNWLESCCFLVVHK